MMDHIDFDEARDELNGRYQKVDLAVASIRSVGELEFAVKRTPDADAHVVHLVQALGETWGHCSCDGYHYHDGPCSHLCGVWRSHQRGLLHVVRTDVSRIVPDVDSDENDVTAPQPDETVIADGGHVQAPPSGHDERTFGRPEQRL